MTFDIESKMIREDEFQWLIDQVYPLSVLEIGSYAGGSLRGFHRNGAISLYSIDLEASQELRDTCKELDISFYTGDSKSEGAIQWANSYKPYDLVFIDGDHSYEGVKKDYENYRHMGKFIAFHDVFIEPGVVQFWQELHSLNSFSTRIEEGIKLRSVLYGHEGIGLVERK